MVGNSVECSLILVYGHEGRFKAAEGLGVDVKTSSLYKTQVPYSPVHHMCHTGSVDFWPGLEENQPGTSEIWFCQKTGDGPSAHHVSCQSSGFVINGFITHLEIRKYSPCPKLGQDPWIDSTCKTFQLRHRMPTIFEERNQGNRDCALKAEVHFVHS